MCGIAGQVRSDDRPVRRALIDAMCAAIRHRGPDSQGIYLDDGVGLGVQRLRIIDLVTGDQPIFNEDKSIAVVLNGEIYNYRELRTALEKAGHRFATRSDTEVIVHLYEERGLDFVESLHGMFALALWDARRRRLVLARDRVGKKPLFYADRDGTLTFASELHALLEDPSVPRALDFEALDAYLALGWVPGPRSAFAAVRKLPPAHILVWGDGRVRVQRYWELRYGPKRRGGPDVEQELRERIRAAVRRRLIADVPLGAFLSGGIDSSAVVAAMAEASSRPVKTFSIGFTTDHYNELPKARLVAKAFGTDHHELVITPDATALLPKLVRQYGEPFADPSALASFYVAEMARRDVTVVLNGDGGDESFGGYTRYVANSLLRTVDVAPARVRTAIGALGRHLPATSRVDSWTARARRFSAALALDPSTRYGAYVADISGFSGLGTASPADIYTDEFREHLGESIARRVVGRVWMDAPNGFLVDRMLRTDVLTYLPDDLLVKMDIATMAYSLEARSPLLDHELMEFAAQLPADFKVKRGQKKVGFRRALRGWIPDAVLDAPKRGFNLPLEHWFRGELHGYAREVLLDPRTTERNYFRRAAVERLLDEHRGSVRDHSGKLWNLLVFELWHRQAVDGDPRTASIPAVAE
jgi:asparagine synthase (glutamine-hydrolysing)